MRFNFKYITIVIVMLNIVQLHGQSYFSTLLPINKYSMNARELAMGGSWHGHGKNPAFGVFDKPTSISFDISRRSYTEKRSFPVIDMFEDVVTQNVYVLNRPSFGSVSWKINSDITKYVKLPLSLSLSGSPFWDMRYEYSEEIRASLGPGVYNRDPVVGYHLLNISGMIESLKFGLATKIGGKIKFGLAFESLYDNDLSYESGVNVLDQDDALASDTTMIHNYYLSIDRVIRPSLGFVLNVRHNLELGLSLVSSSKVKFNTGGLVPIVNEKIQLPGFDFSDSTSSYTVSLPQQIGVSLAAHLDNPTKTIVSGGINFVDWQNHDSQVIKHAMIDTVDFKYQSTVGISFGVEHWILNKTPFRFGFVYSESPLGDEFEITNVSIGSGWVYNNLSIDIAALFGSVEYMYTDLFTPQGQTASDLERVNESNAVLKATLTYSF